MSDEAATSTSAQPSSPDTSGSTPAPSSSAAAHRETVPPVEVAREALSRVKAGEDANTIRRDLQARARDGGRSKASQTPTPQTRPATTRTEAGQGQHSPESPAPAQAPAEDPLDGLTGKERKALERSKFDFSTAQSIPLNNLKAYAKGLMASQAEATRQFQQQRPGQVQEPKPGEADQVPAPQQQPPSQNTQQEVASPQPSSPQAKPADDASASPLAAFGSWKMAPEARANLVEVAGDKFADAIGQQLEGIAQRSAEQARLLFQAVQERFSQVDQYINVLGQAKLDGDYQASFKETLGSDQWKALKLTPEQKTKLREECDTLILAKRSKGYHYAQALPTALAALFGAEQLQNAQQQAALRQSEALAGSLDRPSGNRAAPSPRTNAERMQTALKAIKAGKKPSEAREAAGYGTE